MPDSSSSPNLLAPLERILAQSRQLVALARAGDWSGLETLLAEREAELSALGENRFLIDVARAERAQEVRAGIAEIQRLNDQIVTLAEQGKAEISKQLRDSLKADKGIQAYEAGKP